MRVIIYKHHSENYYSLNSFANSLPRSSSGGLYFLDDFIFLLSNTFIILFLYKTYPLNTPSNIQTGYKINLGPISYNSVLVVYLFTTSLKI
jgi:hypothetical protein